MITNRTPDLSTLDVEALVREKAMLKRHESRVSEIGCWHTHPFHPDTRFERSDGLPSEADMQTLLSSRDYLDAPSTSG